MGRSKAAQRHGDLLALSWSAVRGGVIELRQSKTGQPVAIPISDDLKKCLGAINRSSATTILTKTDGLPWEPKGNGFRVAWRDVCKEARIADVTFHDLRGTFVTRRFAEGWTPHEVASCIGHSIQDLVMLDRYADRGRIAEATARRIIGRTAKNAD